MQIAIVLIVLPLIVFSGWQKAKDFDPYSDSFFTKTYVEPTDEMPDEMRFVGWIMVGIGGLVAYAGVSGLRKPELSKGMSLLILLLGLEVMAFGGTFFAAARSVEDKIAAHAPEAQPES